MNRRDAFKWMLGGLALAGAPSWLAASPVATEFFVFIHAAGGWDVTLWSDPRNEAVGIIDPASDLNTDIGGLAHWRPAGASFELVRSRSGNLTVGPAIGGLHDLLDRVTIINGIAMNTVSHEDGTAYSTTGRHRVGGALAQSSIDVLLAKRTRATQLMPAVSVRFHRRSSETSSIGGCAGARRHGRRGDQVVCAQPAVPAAQRSSCDLRTPHRGGGLARRQLDTPDGVRAAGEPACGPTQALDGDFATAFGSRQLPGELSSDQLSGPPRRGDGGSRLRCRGVEAKTSPDA